MKYILAIYHNNTSLSALKRIKDIANYQMVIVSNKPFSVFIKNLLFIFSKKENNKFPKNKLVNKNFTEKYYKKNKLFFIKSLILCIIDIFYILALLIIYNPNKIFISSDRTSIVESLIAKFFSKHKDVIVLPISDLPYWDAILRARGLNKNYEKKLKKILNKKVINSNDIFYPPDINKVRRIFNLLPPNPFLVSSFPNTKVWFKSKGNLEEFLMAGGDQENKNNIADLDLILAWHCKKIKNKFKYFINPPHYNEDGDFTKEKQNLLIDEIIKLVPNNQEKGLFLHPKMNPEEYLFLEKKYKYLSIITEPYYKYITLNSILISVPSSIAFTSSRIGANVIIIDPLSNLKGKDFYSDFCLKYLRKKDFPTFKELQYEVNSIVSNISKKNNLINKSVLSFQEMELFKKINGK